MNSDTFGRGRRGPPKPPPGHYEGKFRSDGTGLIRKASIEEKLGHRARALELYGQIPALLRAAGDLVREADAAAKQAVEGVSYPGEILPDLRWYDPKVDDPGEMSKLAARVRENLDRNMWKGLLVTTGMVALMDEQARKEFNAGLAKDPPEVTRETVLATLEGLHKDAAVIFRRGLVNAFAKLCRDYKSHDGFKIGKRTIITYAFSTLTYGGRTALGSFQRDDVVRDIDRVLHVLDGKPPPKEHNDGIVGLIRSARYGEPGEVENEYLMVRWFQNGNAHLWMKREDLRARANKLIAEHYGEVVGAGPDVAERSFWRPESHHRAVDAYHPTPPDLAERMVAEAGVRPGMRVLEPSAGTGHITVAILAAGVTPDCVEKDVLRAVELRQILGPDAPIICGDFFDEEPAPIYDRIVMNPPMGANAEMYHVLHALRFLKPGGRLVAVMPKDCEERKGGGGELIEVARAYAHHLDLYDASFEELPWRTFPDVGISLVVVTMDKPDAARAAA